MLVRGALSLVRANVPKTSARDVARLSHQLRRTVISAHAPTAANAPIIAARAYATAQATKPKKAAPKTKTSTAKKPVAKKPVKKTVKKTPVKTTTKKPAKKAAAKKPKAKKPVSEESKARLAKRKESEQIAILKEKALKEPKNLPQNTWAVVVSEVYRSQGEKEKLVDAVRAAKEKYENLSPAERERYNHISNENKAANQTAYQKWLDSHDAATIKQANWVRGLLTKKYGFKNYKQIRDDRRVRRPIPSYMHFWRERYDSGDMKGIPIVEVGRLVGKEWKALNDSQKQKYKDLADQDTKRYIKEHKAVYGVEPEEVKNTIRGLKSLKS